MIFIFSILIVLCLLPFLLAGGMGMFRGALFFAAIMVGSYTWQQIQDVRDQYYDPTEERYGVHEEKIMENHNNYGGDKVWREQFNEKLIANNIPQDRWNDYEVAYIDYEVIDKFDSNFDEVSADIRNLPLEGYLLYKRLRKEHNAVFKVEKAKVNVEDEELKYESNLAAWKQAMEDQETLMMIYWVISMVAVSEVFDFLNSPITLRGIRYTCTLLILFLVLIMPVLFVIFPGFFRIQQDYLGKGYFRTCWSLWPLWFPICSVSVTSVLGVWGVLPGKE